MKLTPKQYDRILQYINAVEDMIKGDCDVLLDVDKNDPVGKLGNSLIELGRKLKTQSQYIETITQLVEKINAGFTTSDILNHIFESFRPYIPYDRIGFSRINEENQTVTALWCRSYSDNVKLDVGYEARLANSTLQDIITTGQPRILNDLEEYLAKNPSSKSTRLIIEEGMRSSLTCPLIVEKKPIGFLFFSSCKPLTYANTHTELFMQLAGIISVTIEKAILYERLMELNELKNKFLGMTVHDLRNPIAIIKGFLDLLLLQDNSDYYTKVFDHIRGQADKMLSLIGDLLDITAIEAGKINIQKKQENIIDVVNDSVKTNRLISIGKNIEIQVDLSLDLPDVYIDKARIAQVMDNLISNAVKFSESGTVITIKVYLKDKSVCVSVADHGQGIPQSDLPKLFQPFSRIGVRPTGGEKSTGLGLAIVKKIIDLHNGSIEVESQPGIGTMVTFCLPALKM
ncbi:MAG: GAF domain-containing sensor histidine kinase [Candidatus Auribacterota bacterium]|nr:GAF domain-containing sensor histidine kinase [Candidatus Auribacterota bacterium]